MRNIFVGIILFVGLLFGEHNYDLVKSYAKKGDNEKMLYYLKKSARANYLQAQNDLAVYYMIATKRKKPNYKKAYYWLSKASQKNHGDALNNLGVLYLNGFGVKKDINKAISFFERAGLQGSVLALFSLGKIYLQKKDYKRAISWFKKAAINNHKDSQNAIGLIYLSGKIVKRDYKKAFYWIKKVADTGDAIAQNNIGVFYLNGFYVNKNGEKAMEWFKKAGKKGYFLAQNNIIMYYLSKKKFRIGFKYAIKYAKMQNPTAQYLLGLIYINGDGTPKDKEKAIYWLKKSAKKGHNKAKILLFDLEEKK